MSQSEFEMYDLYWDNGREGCIIKANTFKEEMEKLVNEYIESDPDEYNIHDFIDWLELVKGVKAELIICYYSNSPVEIDGTHHSIHF